MKQWSYSYENASDFREYVKREGIDREREILVQVNCGIYIPEKVRELQEVIGEALPHAIVTGASSVLQLCDGKLVEGRIVLAITVFEHSTLSFFEYAFPSPGTLEYTDVIASIEDLIEANTKGILLLTNTVHFDIEKLIRRANRSFGSIPVFGGIASDREPFEQFVVFSKDRVYDKEEGLMAVLMHSDVLQIDCNYFFDWEPIGKEYTVTKAEGRYLYELDGKSILEVYENYFGPLDEKKLLHLSLSHPLIRYSREFGQVARALLEMEDGRGLYTGEFKEGEKVQIGFGHYKRMMSRYEIIPEVYKTVPAEVLWFYVCISYQYGYFDILDASTSFYKDPDRLYGLVTFGEFSHKNGRNRFLNFSLTRVALSEDPESHIAIELKEIEHGPKDALLATLSTLVASSSREIMDLNRYLEKEVEKRTKELAELNASLEKRIEIEVRKNREKDKMLYHQSKLAAMGEMINNIAHQWRQPLNIIALVMQDLSLKAQMGTLSAPAILQAKKKIHDTLKYLSDTIDDFRSFASSGQSYSHPGAMEVCNTIRDTVRLVSIVLEDEKIKLKLSLPEKEAMVKGSPNDLKQVLLNLVYNAIDAFREREVENPTIKIEVKYNRKKATILVRDNAGGIDPKIIDKIFEPYFTTKYQARGTGLGLYMSKMIVEKRFGGKISARNMRSGAAFWVELPIMA
ncbi:FIST N-terminal domain-containing protein [Hydrogenimonas sp.]